MYRVQSPYNNNTEVLSQYNRSAGKLKTVETVITFKSVLHKPKEILMEFIDTRSNRYGRGRYSCYSFSGPGLSSVASCTYFLSEKTLLSVNIDNSRYINIVQRISENEEIKKLL